MKTVYTKYSTRLVSFHRRGIQFIVKILNVGIAHNRLLLWTHLSEKLKMAFNLIEVEVQSLKNLKKSENDFKQTESEYTI